VSGFLFIIGYFTRQIIFVMQKKVTQGTGAFYDIELTLTADDYAK